MPGRIEAGPEVIAPREAQAGEQVEGLPAHGADAVDDRTGVGLGVLQRAVQVVDNRQPALGDLGLRSFPGLAHLPGAPLAHVVQFGQGAQPLVLQLRDAGRGRVPAVDGLAVNRLAFDGLAVDQLRVVRPGSGLYVRLDVRLYVRPGAFAPVTHGW